MKTVDPQNPQVLLLVCGLQEIACAMQGTVVIIEENDRLHAHVFYGLGQWDGPSACEARRDAISFKVKCEREGKLRIFVRPGVAEIIVPLGGY